VALDAMPEDGIELRRARAQRADMQQIGLAVHGLGVQ
jgi:hypothetical protein